MSYIYKFIVYTITFCTIIYTTFAQQSMDLLQQQIQQSDTTQQSLADIDVATEIADVLSNSSTLVQHGDHYHTEQDIEENSGTVLLYLILTVIVMQSVLVYWRRYYKKSFDIASLVLLWIIPIIWSITSQYYYMIIIWSLFTGCTLYILYLARQRPLHNTTPRLIYSWFFYTFVISYYICVVGYIMIMCDIIYVTSLIIPEYFQPLSTIGVLLLWYGLYFGTLIRDCASVASTLLTVGLGYGSKDLLPMKSLNYNQCAICNDILPHDNDTAEYTIQLNCGHKYHEFCLQGFLLVAKQDYCVQCNEKVNTRDLFVSKSPWLTQKWGWSKALDYTRAVVVLIPTFIMAAQYIIEFLY